MYAVNNLEGFLKEASVYEWTVLGTTSSNLTEGLNEDRLQHEAADSDGPIVVDCSKYVVDGPTMVVLGKRVQELFQGHSF